MDQQNTPQQVNESQPVADARPTAGLAIASLVLGILAFISGFFWFLAAPLGITSLALGIISLVKKMGGKGMAIAGVVLSAIALVFTTMISLVALAALPSLQENTRDIQRKSDLSAVSAAITAYMSNNRGSLPEASTTTIENINGVNDTDLRDPSTNQPYQIVEGDSTGTGTIGYSRGKDCAGVMSERNYSVNIRLEQGNELYCVD